MIRLTDEMIEPLCSLHSFIRLGRENIFRARLLAPDDLTVGVYVNQPDDFIVITWSGLHWIHDEKAL